LQLSLDNAVEIFVPCYRRVIRPSQSDHSVRDASNSLQRNYDVKRFQ